MSTRASASASVPSTPKAFASRPAVTGAMPTSTRGPSADGRLRAHPLRDRQQVAAHQQVALARDLRQDREQRLAREVLEAQVRITRDRRSRRARRNRRRSRAARRAPAPRATAPRPPGSGAARASGGRGRRSPSSGSAGGGRSGHAAAGGSGGPRPCGLVASAVASNVGSSIVWHMPRTHSSPIGSTSMSAPQWSSQNSPWSSSITFMRKSMNCGGAPMSSWMFLRITSTVEPRKPSSSCMRTE